MSSYVHTTIQVQSYVHTTIQVTFLNELAVGAFSLSCSSFEILLASVFVQRNKS
jgi:hypothetical protein